MTTLPFAPFTAEIADAICAGQPPTGDAAADPIAVAWQPAMADGFRAATEAGQTPSWTPEVWPTSSDAIGAAAFDAGLRFAAQRLGRPVRRLTRIPGSNPLAGSAIVIGTVGAEWTAEHRGETFRGDHAGLYRFLATECSADTCAVFASRRSFGALLSAARQDDERGHTGRVGIAWIEHWAHTPARVFACAERLAMAFATDNAADRERALTPWLRAFGCPSDTFDRRCVERLVAAIETGSRWDNAWFTDDRKRSIDDLLDRTRRGYSATAQSVHAAALELVGNEQRESALAAAALLDPLGLRAAHWAGTAFTGRVTGRAGRGFAVELWTPVPPRLKAGRAARVVLDDCTEHVKATVESYVVRDGTVTAHVTIESPQTVSRLDHTLATGPVVTVSDVAEPLGAVENRLKSLSFRTKRTWVSATRLDTNPARFDAPMWVTAAAAGAPVDRRET